MNPDLFPDRLPRSPLTLVVGQIRFCPILDIHDLLPKIQHKMRQNDLPGHEEQRIQQLSIGPKIETDEVRRYVFQNRTRTEAAFLTDRFVVLATSTHETFSTFNSRLQSIAAAVFSIAEPQYIEQLGLRYLNLLRNLEQMTSSEMVVQTLRGITAEKLGCKSTRSVATTQAQTPFGQLTIRCLQLRGEAFLPPDLQIENMEFPNKPEANEEFRLLDIDHVSVGKTYEIEQLPTAMNDLHEFNRLGFIRSVSDEAIELWRQP